MNDNNADATEDMSYLLLPLLLYKHCKENSRKQQSTQREGSTEHNQLQKGPVRAVQGIQLLRSCCCRYCCCCRVVVDVAVGVGMVVAEAKRAAASYGLGHRLLIGSGSAIGSYLLIRSNFRK